MVNSPITIGIQGSCHRENFKNVGHVSVQQKLTEHCESTIKKGWKSNQEKMRSKLRQ